VRFVLPARGGGSPDAETKNIAAYWICSGRTENAILFTTLYWTEGTCFYWAHSQPGHSEKAERGGVGLKVVWRVKMMGEALFGVVFLVGLTGVYATQAGNLNTKDIEDKAEVKKNAMYNRVGK
jgi:hypothetical protein